MNQSRSADIRPPKSIVPEMKAYSVDFSRYHQVCQQVSTVKNHFKNTFLILETVFQQKLRSTLFRKQKHHVQTLLRTTKLLNKKETLLLIQQ